MLQKSHKKRRKEIIKKLIGKKVWITELGELNPAKIQYSGIYVPIPEYSIAVWHGKRPVDNKKVASN